MKKSKQDRRTEAEMRQEYRNELSAKDQLARLDERLGDGVGATKERQRLEQQIGD